MAAKKKSTSKNPPKRTDAAGRSGFGAGKPRPKESDRMVERSSNVSEYMYDESTRKKMNRPSSQQPLPLQRIGTGKATSASKARNAKNVAAFLKEQKMAAVQKNVDKFKKGKK
jgi:hypothetical protein